MLINCKSHIAISISLERRTRARLDERWGPRCLTTVITYIHLHSFKKHILSKSISNPRASVSGCSSLCRACEHEIAVHDDIPDSIMPTRIPMERVLHYRVSRLERTSCLMYGWSDFKSFFILNLTVFLTKYKRL